MQFKVFIPPTGPEDRIRVTSPYGWRILNGQKQFHPGWDLRTIWPRKEYDGLIRAHESLVIMRIEDYGGYKYIDASGASGLFYRFGHVEPVTDLRENQEIVRGYYFSRAGLFATTSLHLHFEVHHVDPAYRKGVDPSEFFAHIHRCDEHGNIIA